MASSSASSGMSYEGSYFTPDKWFAFQDGFTRSEVSSSSTTSGSSSASGSSQSDSESWSDSEGEADIPIFFPTPFEELSSVQYYTLDEQLTELTAALKQQFQRHCFIQIRQQETQPMLVPYVVPVTAFTYNRQMLDYYIQRQHEKQHALPASEIDSLLELQEENLLQAARPTAAILEPEDDRQTINLIPQGNAFVPAASMSKPIWNRTDVLPKTAHRKRGPQPDRENHEKVASIIWAYGENWTTDDNLLEICEELDRQKVPVPKTWLTRKDGVSRTWSRGRHHYQHLVVKAIKDRLKAAESAKP